MKLWVGLGNPGAKYSQNRHNIGFMALDHIAADHGFSPWRSKFQGQICEGVLGGQKVILLKPETYMNRSGQSVGDTIRFFKLTAQDVTVFHDELDLAPSKLRLKSSGGHAGHNGLRSLHEHIGEAYHRVRLGIGHPGHKDRVAAYVLSDFSKADQSWLELMLRGISNGAEALAEDNGAQFQNALAMKTAAPPTRETTRERKSRDTAPPPAEAVGTPKDSRSPLQKLVDRFR